MHKTTVTACAFVLILIGSFLGVWSAVALTQEVRTMSVAFLLVGVTSFGMGVWMWGKGEDDNDE